MKTKNDAPATRLSDRLIGFLAFPIVNIILLLLIAAANDPQSRSVSTALPWVVNGLVIVLALVRRPQIALGYIAFPVMLIVAGIGICGFLIASCFVILIPASSLNANGRSSGADLAILGTLCFGGVILFLLATWRPARNVVTELFDNIRHWFSD